MTNIPFLRTPTRARKGPKAGHTGPASLPAHAREHGSVTLKPVRTPVAIFGSLGVCIYVPAGRHWLISFPPIHLT